MLGDVAAAAKDRNTEWTYKVGKKIEVRTSYYFMRSPRGSI
jgi:hypothetical protein